MNRLADEDWDPVSAFDILNTKYSGRLRGSGGYGAGNGFGSFYYRHQISLEAETNYF
jgi:hypothetical protein